jgi:hypothetical protein
MEEWFYVKNNLIEREDIKGIIQRPIWSRFGLRRPATVLGNDTKACHKAFNNVCAFIGTRDLVQEHIANRVWPFVNDWEMPKETAAGSSQGSLVYLKYTFRYRDQFDEPNDDCLTCVEATNDELLGAYTRAEDDAMTLAFGGRGKKRLNRIFDVIGFVYPDYTYSSRKQGKKRKTAASATSIVPKGKKIKILTHRPRYIETATVSKLGEGTSSTAEAEQAAPSGRSTEESDVVPKVSATGSVEVPKHTTEAKGKAAEKPDREETAGPPEPELPKVAKTPTITPKRRRMASVLGAVMETTRALTPTPVKKVAESAIARAEPEVGPSMPHEAERTGTEERTEGPSDIGLVLMKKDVSKKVKSPTPEAPFEDLDFIIRHALGKRLFEEEIVEAKHYTRELKYPKGALVYNGTDEDDFLYCLLDNKEISVCRKMTKNMGFPKLEADLSTMSKDDLADSLAYNSLKVRVGDHN